MQDHYSLVGKRILIAGGTRGIGRAISLRFARAGACVIANYVRDDTSAEKLKQESIDEGLSLEIYRADLTSQKGLQSLNEFLGDASARLSGLVYCAATGVHRSVSELTIRHFDWVFSLNVRAFFELVKLLMPRFSETSTIVAISSRGATRAVPSYSLVGSSKGALEALSRHLAFELAPKGIRVNVLSPGSVLTDAWEVMPDSALRIAETIKRTPLGRLVTADEVAWAAQFLCSDASKGIIGHTLVIDGGSSIVE